MDTGNLNTNNKIQNKELARRILKNYDLPPNGIALMGLAGTIFVGSLIALCVFLQLGDITNSIYAGIALTASAIVIIVARFIFLKDYWRHIAQVEAGDYYISEFTVCKMVLVAQNASALGGFINALATYNKRHDEVDGNDMFRITLNDSAEIDIWDHAAEQIHKGSVIKRLYLEDDDQYCGFLIDDMTPSRSKINDRSLEHLREICFE